jgi:hypothetical protein
MNIVLRREFITNEDIYCDLAVVCTMERKENHLETIDYFPSPQAVPNDKSNLKFGPIPLEAFTAIYD